VLIVINYSAFNKLLAKLSYPAKKVSSSFRKLER
jgi:hypothetical protein